MRAMWTKPLLQKTDDQPYENTDPDFAPAIINVVVSYHAEYSAGGQRRGRNHDMTFENIRVYGRQKPILAFKGYDNEHMTENITVKNVFINDNPLEDYECIANEFTNNIVIKEENPLTVWLADFLI